MCCYVPQQRAVEKWGQYQKEHCCSFPGQFGHILHLHQLSTNTVEIMQFVLSTVSVQAYIHMDRAVGSDTLYGKLIQLILTPSTPTNFLSQPLHPYTSCYSLVPRLCDLGMRPHPHPHNPSCTHLPHSYTLKATSSTYTYTPPSHTRALSHCAHVTYPPPAFSLIPRPSMPPIFDCLQYAKTASDQKLEA